MEYLYAPWRSVYLMEVHPPGCLFCGFEEKNDRKNLVLERRENWYLLINKYPYTTGHIMVVCNRHVEHVSELNQAEGAELPLVLARAERALLNAYRPDGINIGANLGQSAGAGIVGHLHLHLVPRWQGDTNFMSTVGGARVVPEDLEDTYERLHAALQKLRR